MAHVLPSITPLFIDPKKVNEKQLTLLARFSRSSIIREKNDKMEIKNKHIPRSMLEFCLSMLRKVFISYLFTRSELLFVLFRTRAYYVICCLEYSGWETKIYNVTIACLGLAIRDIVKDPKIISPSLQKLEQQANIFDLQWQLRKFFEDVYQTYYFARQLEILNEQKSATKKHLLAALLLDGEEILFQPIGADKLNEIIQEEQSDFATTAKRFDDTVYDEF